VTVRTARCGCGALTARAEGEPDRISVCHCLECKRRTGSAFSWNAHWPADRVETDGPYETFERGSDDGYWGRHHFCPRCGITVFYEIERRPGMISIPVGAFADPGFPPPQVEVYTERRCAWLPQLAPEQHF
jgi:hypothetical protein